MSVAITGLGVGLPERVVSNDELSRFFDTSDQWIRTRTGIEKRRVCVNETLLDLSLIATNQALENSKTKPSELDLIICATMQGDTISPSLACMVQKKIGAKCPAFDVNAACSGFIYALDIAKNYILGSGYKKVLIVCADMMSRHVDWTKRDTSVLFGDAASACIVEPGNSLSYINLTSMGCDEFIHHKVAGGNCPFRENHPGEKLVLNGQEVYKFAIGAASDEIDKGLKKLKISAADIDYFVLHQANKRIIDTISETLKLSADKFPINIQNYGNTSSASLLLLLHEMREEGKLKKGDKLFLAAFGGGLSSAAALIEWQ